MSGEINRIQPDDDRFKKNKSSKPSDDQKPPSGALEGAAGSGTKPPGEAVKNKQTKDSKKKGMGEVKKSETADGNLKNPGDGIERPPMQNTVSFFPGTADSGGNDPKAFLAKVEEAGIKLGELLSDSKGNEDKFLKKLKEVLVEKKLNSDEVEDYKIELLKLAKEQTAKEAEITKKEIEKLKAGLGLMTKEEKAKRAKELISLIEKGTYGPKIKEELKLTLFELIKDKGVIEKLLKDRLAENSQNETTMLQKNS